MVDLDQGIEDAREKDLAPAVEAEQRHGGVGHLKAKSGLCQDPPSDVDTLIAIRIYIAKKGNTVKQGKRQVVLECWRFSTPLVKNVMDFGL